MAAVSGTVPIVFIMRHTIDPGILFDKNIHVNWNMIEKNNSHCITLFFPKFSNNFGQEKRHTSIIKFTMIADVPY